MPRTAISTARTAISTPRLAVRNVNAALNFDGTGDYVDIGTKDLGLGDTVTFSCWAYVSQTGTLTIWGCNNAAGEMIINVTAGNLFRAFVNGTIFMATSAAIPIKQWVHLVYTRNGAGATHVAYVNGVSVNLGNNVSTSYSASTASNKYIGTRTSASEPFNGILSDVRIWTRCLTAAEVANLYYQGTFSRTNLVGEWKLSEGAGTVANDTSTSGNNGTITNAVFTSNTPFKSRQLVNRNLVANGDFEFAPPFTAATNTGARWVDGTAGGSTTNDLFSWATLSGTTAGTFGVSFDTSVKDTGSASLKLDLISTGSTVDVTSMTALSAAALKQYAIPVLPSTSYGATYRMKTTYTSGSSGSLGAKCKFVERDAANGNSVVNTGTEINTTVDWTTYTVSFTTASTTRFLLARPSIEGNTGSQTLIMTAWYDNIEIRPTTPTVRTAVT